MRNPSSVTVSGESLSSRTCLRRRSACTTTAITATSAKSIPAAESPTRTHSPTLMPELRRGLFRGRRRAGSGCAGGRRALARRAFFLTRIRDVKAGTFENNRGRIYDATQFAATDTARLRVLIVEPVAHLNDVLALRTLVIVQRHIGSKYSQA